MGGKTTIKTGRNAARSPITTAKNAELKGSTLFRQGGKARYEQDAWDEILGGDETPGSTGADVVAAAGQAGGSDPDALAIPPELSASTASSASGVEPMLDDSGPEAPMDEPDDIGDALAELGIQDDELKNELASDIAHEDHVDSRLIDQAIEIQKEKFEKKKMKAAALGKPEPKQTSDEINAEIQAIFKKLQKKHADKALIKDDIGEVLKKAGVEDTDLKKELAEKIVSKKDEQEKQAKINARYEAALVLEKELEKKYGEKALEKAFYEAQDKLFKIDEFSKEASLRAAQEALDKELENKIEQLNKFFGPQLIQAAEDSLHVTSKFDEQNEFDKLALIEEKALKIYQGSLDGLVEDYNSHDVVLALDAAKNDIMLHTGETPNVMDVLKEASKVLKKNAGLALKKEIVEQYGDEVYKKAIGEVDPTMHQKLFEETVKANAKKVYNQVKAEEQAKAEEEANKKKAHFENEMEELKNNYGEQAFNKAKAKIENEFPGASLEKKWELVQEELELESKKKAQIKADQEQQKKNDEEHEAAMAQLKELKTVYGSSAVLSAMNVAAKKYPGMPLVEAVKKILAEQAQAAKPLGETPAGSGVGSDTAGATKKGSIPTAKLENIMVGNPIFGSVVKGIGAIFEGKDGMRRLARWYHDSAQAYCDAVAASFYNALGIDSLKPNFANYEKADGTQLLGVVYDGLQKFDGGEIQNAKMMGMTPEIAQQIANGIAADIVLGANTANGIYVNKYGKPTRLPSGQALLFSGSDATGKGVKKKKAELDLVDISIDSDVGKKFSAAGVHGQDAIIKSLKGQVEKLQALYDQTGGFESLVVSNSIIKKTEQKKILQVMRKRFMDLRALVGLGKAD